jgi:leucyl aminopeptidase (aminopeptidase T)
MDKYKEMLSAASGAIKYIFNPNYYDRILILTDKYSYNFAKAFNEAFHLLKCPINTFEIFDDDRPLQEIPKELEALLPEKTIVLNIIKAFPEEIPFRIKWIFKVEENKKIKMGHMPGITEDMMLNSVNVDFEKMKQTASFLCKSFLNAEQLHITTEEGTDILLGVKDRIFSNDISIKEGEMCNLPCGEIYCAPLETEAKGVIVFNASIGDIGILKYPLRVYVNKGKIVKFQSDDEILIKKISELTAVDEQARVIGELGIGLNPGARITGNMLEDEKTLGTAHIAFGNNEDFPGGGKNSSKIHRDYLFYQPTLEVEYLDGTKKVVLMKGEII